MSRQRPAPRLHRQARRQRPFETAAQLQPRARLAVAAVPATPRLERRRQRPPAPQRIPAAALHRQPQAPRVHRHRRNRLSIVLHRIPRRLPRAFQRQRQTARRQHRDRTAQRRAQKRAVAFLNPETIHHLGVRDLDLALAVAQRAPRKRPVRARPPRIRVHSRHPTLVNPCDRLAPAPVRIFDLALRPCRPDAAPQSLSQRRVHAHMRREQFARPVQLRLVQRQRPQGPAAPHDRAPVTGTAVTAALFAACAQAQHERPALQRLAP